MTAPGELPTREEIAAILAGDDDAPQESDYYFADQVLARLRPAWDALIERTRYEDEGLVLPLREQIKRLQETNLELGRDIHGRDIRLDAIRADLQRAQEQVSTYHEQLKRYFTEIGAKSADLRACAEALAELVLDETIVDAVAFGLSVQKACAALARPGVQKALRSEPKATAP